MKKFQGYIAVVLDGISSTSLKKFIPPIHTKLFYHHMTMAFMPEEETLKKYEHMLGQEVELHIIGMCFDDKGQVAIVETELSEKSVPHITLSCAEEVTPKYSDTLLKNNTNYQSLDLKVKGVVEAVEFK